MNRRHFLKTTAAAAAYTSLAAGTSSAFADSTYRVGLIGSGWYGKSDLFRLIQVAPVEVIALCDPDKNMVSSAAQAISKRQKSGNIPKQYGDYQTLLKENQLDIVLVGSPDHWHALHAIEAMKSGAHVYLQKPISVDVIEGEAVVAAAQKYNRVVQIGTQRRSTPHLVEAKKNIVDAGKLGKVSHAEICCYYHMRSNANPATQSVPDYFDYQMWTGPAPLLPFTGLPHRRWRANMEYGNGIVGDMCVHMLDAVRWMLNLGWPSQITSTGGIFVQKQSASNISDTQTALFDFGELKVTWQHRTWGTPADPEYPWCFKLYGDKGTLAGDPFKCDFYPVSGNGERIHKDALYEREQYPEDVTEPDIEIHAAPATREHMRNFVQGIERGTLPVANVKEGHISTASCVLANMSMKLGRPLAYDPAKRIVPGDKEATRALARPYRAPWIHPDPDKV